MKDRETYRRDCQINSELLLENYLKNSREGFKDQFEKGKSLANTVLDDYMRSWPEVPVMNPHVVGTLVVYVVWKLRDLDFRWGYPNFHGGCHNPTMRENLDAFVEALNGCNVRYVMDRPGTKGKITIHRVEGNQPLNRNRGLGR